MAEGAADSFVLGGIDAGNPMLPDTLVMDGEASDSEAESEEAGQTPVKGNGRTKEKKRDVEEERLLEAWLRLCFKVYIDININTQQNIDIDKSINEYIYIYVYNPSQLSEACVTGHFPSHTLMGLMGSHPGHCSNG